MKKFFLPEPFFSILGGNVTKNVINLYDKVLIYRRIFFILRLVV